MGLAAGGEVNWLLRRFEQRVLGGTVSTATREPALQLRGGDADAPLPHSATEPMNESTAAAVDPATPPRTLAPNDPRWVLAVRVREALQGTLLLPDARQRLLKLGRLLGLNGFESNLVIAIVQDAARRGESVHLAEGSLAMVPRRNAESATSPTPGKSSRIAMVVLVLVAVEALVLYLLVA